jgi:RNA polymerase sigma-70 factor (ECF subfamily)
VPRDSSPPSSREADYLLNQLQPRLDSLFSQSRASEWSVSHLQFRSAVERSVRRRFADCTSTQAALEEYLETLHLDDLVLACGCMQGSEAAWEYFIHTYRPYLRAAAGAITRNSTAGLDLADSLFAELYGLADGKRGEASLFRYFHGRSSLKTWLRTVLAQRHVDRLRRTRRLQPLEHGDGEEKALLPQNVSTTPLDPYRALYLQRFLQALTVCLAQLEHDDRKRLELYYAREKTLAEIGRLLGEHESSASRNLERARKELRAKVEQHLRTGVPSDSSAVLSPMSDAEITACFQYASEDAPIDFRQLFPEKSVTKREAGRKDSP